jgi:iron complex transport system substrate-binding protein
MSGPRIVSLLPSATEIAVALGCEAQLFGRSHECDFPPAVQALPVCTATKLAKGLPSLEIENRVQAIVSQGLSCYEVDAQLLRSLRPDVILTQTACAVCAVTPRDLEEALSAWSGHAPTLLSFAPDRLVDVWGDLRAAGDLLEVPARAEVAIEQLQARLEAIGRKTRGRARPTVAAIEWVEPLMAAGNWVPELIELAGGQSLFAAIGEHSPWLEWDQLSAADPEVIVLMPCGFTIERTVQDVLDLVKDPRWQGLSAGRRGAVYIVDGHHYFNRPGPRLVESAEILAEILHPDLFDFGHKGPGWVQMAFRQEHSIGDAKIL